MSTSLANALAAGSLVTAKSHWSIPSLYVLSEIGRWLVETTQWTCNYGPVPIAKHNDRQDKTFRLWTLPYHGEGKEKWRNGGNGGNSEMAETAEMLGNVVPIHNQAQPPCQTPPTNKPHPCKSLTEQIPKPPYTLYSVVQFSHKEHIEGSKYTMPGLHWYN